MVFVGVLKVKYENSRIRNRINWSEARIRGSGSVPKCHGSTTLFLNSQVGKYVRLTKINNLLFCWPHRSWDRTRQCWATAHRSHRKTTSRRACQRRAGSRPSWVPAGRRRGPAAFWPLRSGRRRRGTPGSWRIPSRHIRRTRRDRTPKKANRNSLKHRDRIGCEVSISASKRQQRKIRENLFRKLP